MLSRKSVLYAAVLAGAVTLGLAGCNGGGDEPTASPTEIHSASTSGSVTVSATASLPVTVSVPAAARAHTEAGAIEFAKWALVQADNGYVSVDATAFQAVSDPSCAGCQVVLEGIAKLKATGYHQKGPALTVDYTGAIEKSQDVPTVELFIIQSTVPMVHTSGVEAAGPTAMRFKTRFKLGWTEFGWIIQEMTKS